MGGGASKDGNFEVGGDIKNDGSGTINLANGSIHNHFPKQDFH